MDASASLRVPTKHTLMYRVCSTISHEHYSPQDINSQKCSLKVSNLVISKKTETYVDNVHGSLEETKRGIFLLVIEL